jgi:hypothetical protein
VAKKKSRDLGEISLELELYVQKQRGKLFINKYKAPEINFL